MSLAMLCRQVAVIHSYLASPLFAFYIELSSGLNLLIKYIFFFSSQNTVTVHLIKRKHKIFGIFVRASGNMATNRDHSEIFMSNVLIM